MQLLRALLRCVVSCALSLLLLTDGFGQYAKKDEGKLRPVVIDSLPVVNHQVKDVVKILPEMEVKESLSPLSALRKFHAPSVKKENLLSSLVSVDIKSPLVNLQDLSVEYGYRSGGFQVTDQSMVSKSVGAGGDLSLGGVPFDLSALQLNDMPFLGKSFNLSSFKLDAERYKQALQQKLLKLGSMDELLSAEAGKLASQKAALIKAFQNKFNGNVRLLKVKNELQGLLNSKEILDQGAGASFRNLSDKVREKIGVRAGAIALMETMTNAEKLLLSDSINALRSEMASLVEFQAEVEKMGADAAILNEADRNIRGFDKKKEAVLQERFNDPETLKSLAAKHLRLNGFQRFLLDARKLNVGALGEEQGTLALHNTLLKGASFEKVSKGNTFAPVLGTIPSITQISDLSYDNLMQRAQTLAGGFGLGKESKSGAFSKMTVMMFQERGGLSAGQLSGFSSNLVATFSQRISIGDGQVISGEISKSMSSFGAGAGKGSSLLSTTSPFQNLGFNFNYNGDFDQAGLSGEANVFYTGQEFTNLGNAYLPGGSKGVSGSARKSFLDDMLLISGKIQYREYDFSLDKRTWQYISYSIGAKWKMKKGQFIELRYQPFNNTRNVDGVKMNTNRANRLSLRGNYQKRLAHGNIYRHYIDVSTFDNVMETVAAAIDQTGSAVTYTSLQTISHGQKTFFLNTVYNKMQTKSNFLFLNTSVSMDGGTSFMLTKQVLYNPALVFNQVSNFYAMAAIRQGLSGKIGKTLNVSGFLQMGTFLRKEQLASGISPFSGNLMVSYKLR